MKIKYILNRIINFINDQTILFFIFFLLLRLLFTYFNYNEEIGGDGGSYNGYALSILRNNDWLTNPSFIGANREPVYPLFLALIYLVFGKGNLFTVYIIQTFISLFTLYFIHKLAIDILGEKKSAIILLWAGFYIHYYRFSALILRETLVFFFVILVFYYIWKMINNQFLDNILKVKHYWYFIFGFAILIHLDARYLFYIPFFFFLFYYYFAKDRLFTFYFWTVSFILVLMVPWTLRNYVAYDSLVIINTRTFDLSQSENGYTTAAKERLPRNLFDIFKPVLFSTLNNNYPSEIERNAIKLGNDSKNRSIEELIAIKRNIYPDSTFIARELYWLKEFWRIVRLKGDYFPFPDARFQSAWSLKHNLLSILCYGFLIPFAIIGLFVMIIEKHRAVVFLSFPIIIQTLLHVLQWSRDRYRMPIDAFIIIIAVYGMFWCLDKYNERKYNAIIEK